MIKITQEKKNIYLEIYFHAYKTLFVQYPNEYTNFSQLHRRSSSDNEKKTKRVWLAWCVKVEGRSLFRPFLIIFVSHEKQEQNILYIFILYWLAICNEYMYSNKSTLSSCCAVNVYKCHIIYRGYTKQQKDISWGKKGTNTLHGYIHRILLLQKTLVLCASVCEVCILYIRERSQLQRAIYIVLVEYLNILGQHKPPTLLSLSLFCYITILTN